MDIEIYTLCHQEAPMVPYFMRHYSQYGQVFMFESHSTDRSRQIAEKMGAIIVDLPTGNEVRDDIFTAMKNNCWRESRADWVIVCDMDEFVYHPDMLEYLERLRCTVIAPKTYEMFSDTFPTTKGQIYEEVCYGSPIGSKYFMFKPTEITEMNFEVGSHSASPKGNVIINDSPEIICMHMRHLNIDYVVRRNAYFKSRRSQINKRNGWGTHVEANRDEIQRWYDVHKQTLIKL